MATKTPSQFVIKKMKAGRDGKKFYSEVGRMTVRRTPRGLRIYLQLPDGDLVAFPVEPKPEQKPNPEQKPIALTVAIPREIPGAYYRDTHEKRLGPYY